MMIASLKKIGLVASGLLVSVALVGCEEKGPAQKAGEGVDNAAKDLKNAVDPRGSAEKVGGKIDNAVGK
jgi:hypothetical protein